MYKSVDMSSLKINKKFRWYVVRDNFFSQQECDELKKMIDKQSTRQDGYYRDTRDHHDEENRSACVINIKKTDDQKLLDKFWSAIQIANIQYYNYDVQGIYNNRIQAHRYDVGDHYKPHADFHWFDNHSTAKLTCILFLNDDYEGGEFRFFDGNVIEPKAGKLVIHPAVAGHEVKPVTKGSRYSCVAWGVGDTFV